MFLTMGLSIFFDANNKEQEDKKEQERNKLGKEKWKEKLFRVFFSFCFGLTFIARNGEFSRDVCTFTLPSTSNRSRREEIFARATICERFASSSEEKRRIGFD